MALFYVETLFDKRFYKLNGAVYAEHTRIYAQIVRRAVAPRLSCIIIIIRRTATFELFYNLFRLVKTALMPFHDTLRTLLKVGRYEHAYRIRHVAKHVVGASAYKYARAVLCRFAYGITLKLEQTLL